MVTSALKPINFSRNKLNTCSEYSFKLQKCSFEKKLICTPTLVPTNSEVRSFKNSLHKDAKKITRLTAQPQFCTSSRAIPWMRLRPLRHRSKWKYSRKKKINKIKRINKAFLILWKCSIKQDTSYLNKNSDWVNIKTEHTFREWAFLNSNTI